jgi:hypothetical protein
MMLSALATPVTRRILLAVAGSAAGALEVRAQSGPTWEVPPEIRPVASVVPANLLRGPHYVLGPEVTTFAYLNRYAVTSDFGDFPASSDARLARLIREIAAIAELRAMQQTDAFKQAAMEAGKSPFRSAKSLIDDPVGTLSAIPEGLGSIFGRAGEQLQRSHRSQYEDGPAMQLLAVSGYKREYAAKLGVDVYSSNEVLQKELNRLAWASAGGNLTLGALSFATGAMALQVASDVRLLEQARSVVEATPPSELSKRNRELLARMKVPDATANGFLQNRMLSPRHQMIIVASMVALGDIPGRAQFIARASSADTEDAALLFQRMAELTAGYSARVSAVRQIAIVQNLPVVTTAKASALLLPIDRLLWTERNAGLAKSLTKPPAHGPQLWITGTASPLAEAGLKKLGLGLTQECGKELPLLD